MSHSDDIDMMSEEEITQCIDELTKEKEKIKYDRNIVKGDGIDFGKVRPEY